MFIFPSSILFLFLFFFLLFQVGGLAGGVVLLGSEHVTELEGEDVVEAELVGGDVLQSSLFGVVGEISLLSTT